MGRKSKFPESERIAAALELERGARATDVARKLGVSLQTVARWREQYIAPHAPPAAGAPSLLPPPLPALDDQTDAQVRALEDENAKLKNLVAQFALEIESLRSELVAYREGSGGKSRGPVGFVARARRPSNRPSA